MSDVSKPPESQEAARSRRTKTDDGDRLLHTRLNGPRVTDMRRLDSRQVHDSADKTRTTPPGDMAGHALRTHLIDVKQSTRNEHPGKEPRHRVEGIGGPQIAENSGKSRPDFLDWDPSKVESGTHNRDKRADTNKSDGDEREPRAEAALVRRPGETDSSWRRRQALGEYRTLDNEYRTSREALITLEQAARAESERLLREEPPMSLSDKATFGYEPPWIKAADDAVKVRAAIEALDERWLEVEIKYRHLEPQQALYRGNSVGPEKTEAQRFAEFINGVNELRQSPLTAIVVDIYDVYTEIKNSSTGPMTPDQYATMRKIVHSGFGFESAATAIGFGVAGAARMMGKGGEAATPEGARPPGSYRSYIERSPSEFKRFVEDEGGALKFPPLSSEAESFMKKVSESPNGTVVRDLDTQTAAELRAKFGFFFAAGLNERGTIASYDALSIATSGVDGLFHAHHILEAHVLEKLGYPTDKAPAVILLNSDHITTHQKLGKLLHPKDVEHMSLQEVHDMYVAAYQDHPNWIHEVDRYFEHAKNR
jgi:hypothetical protein